MSAHVTGAGVEVVRDDFKAASDSLDELLRFLAAARASRKILVVGRISDHPGRSRSVYTTFGRAAAAVADLLVFVGERPEALWGGDDLARLRPSARRVPEHTGARGGLRDGSRRQPLSRRRAAARRPPGAQGLRRFRSPRAHRARARRVRAVLAGPLRSRGGVRCLRAARSPCGAARRAASCTPDAIISLPWSQFPRSSSTASSSGSRASRGRQRCCRRSASCQMTARRSLAARRAGDRAASRRRAGHRTREHRHVRGRRAARRGARRRRWRRRARVCHPDTLVARARTCGVGTFRRGEVTWLDLLGDGTIVHSVKRHPSSPLARAGGAPPMRAIDHVTYCLPYGALDRVARAYQDVLGLALVPGRGAMSATTPLNAKRRVA